MGIQTSTGTGLNVNTTTQQQMTTERSAPGLSLLDRDLLVTLEQRGAAIAQRAAGLHRHHPKQAGFCGQRAAHAHHIRRGKLWS
jgi:hypothetical protein